MIGALILSCALGQHHVGDALPPLDRKETGKLLRVAEEQMAA